MQAALPSVASPPLKHAPNRAQAQRQVQLSERMDASSLFLRENMRRSSWIRNAGGALLAVAAQVAPAQSRSGSIAAQSSATIAIRISVSPRFTVAPAPGGTSGGVEGADGRSDAITVGSNAPSLRTRLVAAAPDPPAKDSLVDFRTGSIRPGNTGGPSARDRRIPPPMLVLITPD